MNASLAVAPQSPPSRSCWCWAQKSAALHKPSLLPKPAPLAKSQPPTKSNSIGWPYRSTCDPAVMNLRSTNVSNAVQHYNAIGETVEIEVVAFGPGLHMLRDDTSPVVKARIKSMSETMPHLRLSACGNTRENMTKTEAKEIPLVSQAKVVKAGVVRLMELQEQG